MDMRELHVFAKKCDTDHIPRATAYWPFFPLNCKNYLKYNDPWPHAEGFSTLSPHWAPRLLHGYHFSRLLKLSAAPWPFSMAQSQSVDSDQRVCVGMAHGQKLSSSIAIV